jgi:hypothetical protein
MGITTSSMSSFVHEVEAPRIPKPVSREALRPVFLRWRRRRLELAVERSFIDTFRSFSVMEHFGKECVDKSCQVSDCKLKTPEALPDVLYLPSPEKLEATGLERTCSWSTSET